MPLKAAKTCCLCNVNNFPETKIFWWQRFGTWKLHENALIQRMNRWVMFQQWSCKILPMWAQLIRTQFGSCVDERLNKKIVKLLKKPSAKSATSISGVPTFTVLLLQHLWKRDKNPSPKSGRTWRCSFDGRLRFNPIENFSRHLIPSQAMRYWETVMPVRDFGIHIKSNSDEMLLMLDHGIFTNSFRLKNRVMPKPEL